jgi:hypothetical protein
VTVTAAPECAWTATSPAPWVTIAEGRSGSGNGTVRLLVEPNDSTARMATLTIAGQEFTLRQNGCTASLKPTYYNAGRGPDDIEIAVTADPGCAWTAASSVPWVTVRDGRTGSGTGLVRLHVQPNTGPARSTTVTIAGEPFALRQEGR